MKEGEIGGEAFGKIGDFARSVSKIVYGETHRHTQYGRVAAIL